MTLSDFDFCNSTSCYVTAMQLKLCGKFFLCKLCFFTQVSDIFTYPFLNIYVHTTLSVLHLFKNKILDFII